MITQNLRFFSFLKSKNYVCVISIHTHTLIYVKIEMITCLNSDYSTDCGRNTPQKYFPNNGNTPVAMVFSHSQCFTITWKAQVG